MIQQTFQTDGARISAYLDGPQWQGAPTATLGKFTCTSPQAGRVVLEQALSCIRAAGLRHVLGPMERDTWHSYRFVTWSDGSAPFMLEPQSGDLPLEVLRAAGFLPVSRYFSSRVDLADAAAVTPPPTDAFEIRAWEGSDPEGLFAQVHQMCCTAFASNAFYQPISRADFLAIYLPIVPLLKKELVLFARRPDDSLAGFLFGLPNYAEGPAPRSVILKTYASVQRGAGQHLAHTFHWAAAAGGFDSAIHALIHDDNLSAQRSAAERAQIFRRYELFGLTLDD